MFDMSVIRKESKEFFYEDLGSFVEGLLFDESDAIANMSNLASLLYHMFEDVNWAGFYLFKEDQLVLGPFHGKPACIRIQLGKGVCGRAAQDRQIQLVSDVHTFEGHIACDGDTNSEIVIPMVKNGELMGVLDIDSPILNRFDEEDQVALAKIVQQLLEASQF